MMTKGFKGEKIKMLQRAILACGYALPRWGVDGDLGDETLRAAAMLLRDHGRIKDLDPSSISDTAFAYILELRDRMAVPNPTPVSFYDCRHRATREVDRGPRPWSLVTRICLHQTACRMGENAPRYDGLGAHGAVTAGGKIFHEHDLNRIVWHGNGWNASSVGIELDGLFAGREDDPATAVDEALRTTWDDPSTKIRELPTRPTTAQVIAAQDYIRWIYCEVERHGGKIVDIVAHRQASKNRQNDPGQDVWQRVALPMREELGLGDYNGKVVGSGYPIPECWDSNHKGVSY